MCLACLADKNRFWLCYSVGVSLFSLWQIGARLTWAALYLSWTGFTRAPCCQWEPLCAWVLRRQFWTSCMRSNLEARSVPCVPCVLPCIAYCAPYCIPWEKWYGESRYAQSSRYSTLAVSPCSIFIKEVYGILRCLWDFTWFHSAYQQSPAVVRCAMLCHTQAIQPILLYSIPFPCHSISIPFHVHFITLYHNLASLFHYDHNNDNHK